MKKNYCGPLIAFRAVSLLRLVLGLLCGTVVLTMNGCARIPAGMPTPEMFHTEVGQVHQAGKDLVFTAGSWPQGDWWESFGDADLNHLMAKALANNPNLAAAQARIAAAQAAVLDARSRLLPHFGAGADLEEQHFSATGEHATLNGHSVLFANLEPVQGTYNPDITGEGAYKLAAKVGKVRVAEAQQAAARLDISTTLVRIWFIVAGVDGALAAEGRQLTLAKRLYVVQKARLVSGLADANGVLSSRLALADLRSRIDQHEGERSAMLAAIAALAGQSPIATADLRPLTPSLRRFPVPVDLPIGLLRHRPDVMAALWQVESARQEVHAARAAFYPQLNLSLFAGWNSIHLEDLLNPSNFAHSVGLSLSLPIFEGGALRAGLAGARARYAFAVDRYNVRVLTAVQEVAAGLALWKANLDAVAQYQRSAAAAHAQARLQRAALRAGLINALPSLTTEIAAAERDKSERQQIALAAQSWVNLVAALGGGYHDKSTQSLPPAGN